MCWDDKNPKRFHMGLRNLMVKTYDTEERRYVNTQTMKYTPVDRKDEIKALHTIDNKFIAGMSSGNINIWSNEEDLSTMRIGDNLQCLSVLPQHNLIATGGQENLMKVWDLTRPEKPIFTAKNVKPDWLDLRVPVGDTTIHFVENSPDTILTTTRHHQIRMYDLRVGVNMNMSKKQRQQPKRRPVIETKFSEYSITASSMIDREPKKVWVGNARGEIACFDLRKPNNVCRSYQPVTGSIRKLVNHPTEPYFFTASLDMYLRLHHEKLKVPVEKVFMKAELNQLIVTSQGVKEKEKEEKKVVKKDKFKTEEEFCNEDSDEEDSDVDEWEKMNEVSSDDDDDEPKRKVPSRD